MRYGRGNPKIIRIIKKSDLFFILAIMEKTICQSCGMPIEKPEQFGTNADGSVNQDYCIYCYKDGKFIDDVSMEEYIDMCSQYWAQSWMTNEEMKEYCTKLFPTLKRWKKSE